MLVFAFELLSTTVGKKASRYNDGSVFSFCAIYTGKHFEVNCILLESCTLA